MAKEAQKDPRNPKQRFIELAQKRTTKVLNNLELIGNLSNKRNYQYDSNQPKQIFQAIEAALRAAKDQFKWASSSRKSSEEFLLNDSQEIKELVNRTSELDEKDL